MQIEVINCSTQRRNAATTAMTLFCERLLGVEAASRLLVQIMYTGDEELLDPVSRTESLSNYIVILPQGLTVIQDCLILARAAAVVRQYVSKRRQLVQNSPSKYRWMGETYDINETQLADNPAFVDAVGVGELLCMELRDRLPVRSHQRRDLHRDS